MALPLQVKSDREDVNAPRTKLATAHTAGRPGVHVPALAEFVFNVTGGLEAVKNIPCKKNHSGRAVMLSTADFQWQKYDYRMSLHKRIHILLNLVGE